PGDGADLVDQRHVVRIQQFQLAPALLGHADDRARDVGRALAALGPVIGQHRLDPELGAAPPDDVDLGVGVGAEAIDGDDRGEAEFLYVLDVALEIGHAGFQRLQILGLEVLLLDPAMHFQRAGSRDQHHAIRLDPGLAAFDVDELLAAEAGAEAGFGAAV